MMRLTGLIVLIGGDEPRTAPRGYTPFWRGILVFNPRSKFLFFIFQTKTMNENKTTYADFAKALGDFNAIADNARQAFEMCFHKWTDAGIKMLQQQIQSPCFNGYGLIAMLENALTMETDDVCRARLLQNVEKSLKRHCFLLDMTDVEKAFPEESCIRNVMIRSVAEWINQASKVIEAGLIELHTMLEGSQPKTAATPQPSNGGSHKRTTEPKQRGRKTKPFVGFFVRNTGQTDYERVKALCDNKQGKDLALVILVAIKEGIMLKPTFRTIEKDCKDIGSESGYAKYMNMGLQAYTAIEIDGMKRLLED